MNNIDIRQIIKAHRLHHYEIADHIGISESTFCVWLRNELTGERREKVMRAIEELTAHE